jgi:hypothetical protein
MKTVQQLKESNPNAFKQLRINYGMRRYAARNEGLPDGDSEDFYQLEFPEICPILGVPIDYNYDKKRTKGGSDFAPSFDKIYPNLGYVKGNVRVVSFLGNRIMSNINDQPNYKNMLMHLASKFIPQEIIK